MHIISIVPSFINLRGTSIFIIHQRPFRVPTTLLPEDTVAGDSGQDGNCKRRPHGDWRSFVPESHLSVAVEGRIEVVALVHEGLKLEAAEEQLAVEASGHLVVGIQLQNGLFAGVRLARWGGYQHLAVGQGKFFA